MSIIICSQICRGKFSVTHSVMSDSLRQAPLSLEFSRQGYWSGFPFPFPGIKPRSPILKADSLLSKPPGKTGKNYI